MKPEIDTILTPALFPLYQKGIEGKNVVVIDVLRATTTICIAFQNGVSSMVPVATPEEARALMKNGYLAAAERNGVTVEGFDFGNSPQEFTPDRVKGKNIAFTTTNGTRALQLSSEAANVFVGSFLNLSGLATKLKEDGRDVILFCAGWKDKINLEDTIYAGALSDLLKEHFNAGGDSVMMARDLFEFAKSNLTEYLQKASHVQRFKSLHVESDLDVCMKTDTVNILPVYRNGVITLS